MSTGQLRAVGDPHRERLVAIAQELERTGWAFELLDADWRRDAGGIPVADVALDA